MLCCRLLKSIFNWSLGRGYAKLDRLIRWFNMFSLYRWLPRQRLSVNAEAELDTANIRAQAVTFGGAWGSVRVRVRREISA